MYDVILIGFGPGGAALSWLFASRGLRTLAVERQTDFHRTFRGEGLQPSGISALHQMGLADALAATPQLRPRRMLVHNGAEVSSFQMADTGGATIVSPGGLLEAIAARCAEHPAFTLLRGAALTDLLEEDGRVVGVRVRTADGVAEHRARLVVAADGRGSLAAKKAGMARDSLEQGFDVLWFKADLGELLGDRDTAWLEMQQGRVALAYPSPDGGDQVGLILPKGTVPEGEGPERWRWMLRQLSPDLAAAVAKHPESWVGPVRLNVICERAQTWARPGLLLIGDAAHPMSPVGGQGLNMAIRDALVAANHLVPALRDGDLGRIDAAARAAATERAQEVVPVQALQTRSGVRMLRPPWWLLKALPWAARLGWRFRANRERQKMSRGLVELHLTV